MKELIFEIDMNLIVKVWIMKIICDLKAWKLVTFLKLICNVNKDNNEKIEGRLESPV